MGDITSIVISGNTGEQCVNNMLVKLGVRFYHNIYFENSNGDIAQIDFLIITERCLICLEVKSFTRCIIRGSEDNKAWTVCYKNKNKSMYNPILQNMKHICIIKDCLPYKNIPIYNYVVFTNSCHLMIDTLDNTNTIVSNMDSLGYDIVELSEGGNRIRRDVLTDIKDKIEEYDSMSATLSDKHCKKYYS